jgi:hypothetical protein
VADIRTPLTAYTPLVWLVDLRSGRSALATSCLAARLLALCWNRRYPAALWVWGPSSGRN